MGCFVMIAKSGIIASALLGILALLVGGIVWLAPLVIFFVFGNIVTRVGKGRKEKMGCGQKKRTWVNVFANGGAFFVFNVMFFLTGNWIFFYSAVASMACATSDTTATELGQLYGKNPRLLNLKKAKPGDAGAMPKEGILASLIGTTVVSSLVLFIDIQMVLPIFCAGFLGASLDSVFGNLEKYGLMNTHVNNFITTLIAGLVVVF